MINNLFKADIEDKGPYRRAEIRTCRNAELIVEIADGVKVRVMRGMISESMSKSGPVPKKSKSDDVDSDIDEADDGYEDQDVDDDVEDEKK